MKNIDWKSKIIDLLIVILGISIAFKLNSWNESKKSESEIKHYLESFYDENTSNMESLEEAIDFVLESKKNLDTLKHLLLSKKTSDPRIIGLSGSMMTFSNFIPSETTMDNIKASGEFELIKNIELRKKLIQVYHSFESSQKMDALLQDHVNKYVVPFYYDNVRFTDFNAPNFSDFGSVNKKFMESSIFLNTVFGYDVLMNQQLESYQSCLERIKTLNESLEANRE